MARGYPGAGGRLPAAAPLPARDGVGASRVYLPDGPWLTVGEYLPGRFPFISPDAIMMRLARGDIVDAAGNPQRADSPYRPRTWLWYYREVPREAKVPFELAILHRDERLVVVDKPHFLASIPGGKHLMETALTRLRRDLDAPDITPVHRLDRDTAGVLVFCADPSARGAYQSLFQSRSVDKEYEALAPAQGAVQQPQVYRSRLEAQPGRVIMRETAGEPNSETEITLLETLAWSALPDTAAARQGPAPGRYRLRPLTGRKHQLRAHMDALGCAILNDPFYGCAAQSSSPEDFSRPLQLLARRIAFDDPYTGQRRVFESRRTLLA